MTTHETTLSVPYCVGDFIRLRSYDHKGEPLPPKILKLSSINNGELGDRLVEPAIGLYDEVENITSLYSVPGFWIRGVDGEPPVIFLPKFVGHLSFRLCAVSLQTPVENILSVHPAVDCDDDLLQPPPASNK